MVVWISWPSGKLKLIFGHPIIKKQSACLSYHFGRLLNALASWTLYCRKSTMLSHISHYSNTSMPHFYIVKLGFTWVYIYQK